MINLIQKKLRGKKLVFIGIRIHHPGSGPADPDPSALK